MQNSDPPQFCHYKCIFANIWYLILLIQSSNIILRIFMFYKQRVLADFWGRKDSAVGINKLFIAHSMCTAQWHMDCCACDWHKSEDYFGLKMQYLWNTNIPGAGNSDWSCLGLSLCEVSNIANIVIMAKLRWVRVLHKCRVFQFLSSNRLIDIVIALNRTS